MRAARRSALAGAAALAAALAAAAPARAQDDGVYGRLDGDLALRAGAGAAFAEGGPALAATAGAVYLETAGLYVHYTDALGQRDARVARSIAAGVHLQPLFLARYANDLERGPAHLDLLLDSLAFGVGAFWHAPPGGALAADPGLELALSLALPILPDATGPHLGLRGALRWTAAHLSGAAPDGPGEQRALLAVTLSWHHVVSAHIVDAGDRVVRAGRRAPRAASAR